MATITVVDYGMGNLHSVSKALEHLGHTACVTAEPETVRRAERLIVPGVGAFGDAMHELEHCALIEPILEFARTGRPLLGVCLGMQLLLETSEESPGVAGLGLIRGTVRRFAPGDLKVPHMGWNTVKQAQRCRLFDGVPDQEYFYFVHSYYVDPAETDVAAGMTEYGVSFPSVLCRDNVMATQYHPEKSQQWGLRMLTNFCEL